jgi:hypothetical protein
MGTPQAVATLVLILSFAAVMVVAAFLDRRRGREIEEDASRVPAGARMRGPHHEQEED